MYHKINKFIDENSTKLQTQISELTNELISANEAVANITKAIEQGIYADNIFSRLEELNAKKETLTANVAELMQTRDVRFTDDDVENTLNQCKLLLRQPTNPENRDFLKMAVKKIVLYREEVIIILNTGLSVNDEFNTEIKATRKEIYEFGRRMKNAC